MGDPPAKKKRRRIRLVGLMLGLLGLYGLAHFLGVADMLQPRKLRALVQEAGAWGPLLFGAMYLAGTLAQLPGMVFLTTAPLLFPLEVALPLCVLAANVAVNLNFFIARRLGGEVLTGFERPWVRRIFGELEEHPFRSVGLLRAVFISFPPMTGAFALTSLRTWDHALATLIGMLPPIALVVVLESLALR